MKAKTKEKKYMNECVKCKKTFAKEMFPQTLSRFFPGGRANLCFNCIEDLIDGANLNDVDRACQWLDYPLLIDKWMQLYKSYREKTFRKYSEMFYAGKYGEGNDWTSTNTKLKVLLSEDRLEEEVPELNQEWLNEMSRKWNLEASGEDFRHLEYLYADLLRTQNIITGTQIDNALKMCKLSWMADKEIKGGRVPKDLLKSYQELAKASDFTPKNAKNAGDFDSCGELFLWLEKVGWRRKFHDFVDKDEVDATITNLQAYTKRLVLGESGLKEDIEQRLEALNNFDINDTDELRDVDENEDMAAMAFLEEEEEEFEI